MAKFCKTCGAMSDDDSLFCCSCGNPFNESAAPKAPQAESNVKQSAPAPDYNAPNGNPPPYTDNRGYNANTYANAPNFGGQYNQYQTPPPNYGYMGFGTPNNGNVTFGQAISLFFSNYANFKGRASKSEYWFVFLLNTVIGMIIGGISGFFAELVPEIAMVFNIISLLYSLATFIPGVAVMVRRLHDTGKSGSYWFISLIPIAGAIILYVQLAKDSEWDNQWGPGNLQNARPPVYNYGNPYYNPYYNPTPDSGYNPYQNSMYGNNYDPYRSNFPNSGYNNNQTPPTA